METSSSFFAYPALNMIVITAFLMEIAPLAMQLLISESLTIRQEGVFPSTDTMTMDFRTLSRCPVITLASLARTHQQIVRAATQEKCYPLTPALPVPQDAQSAPHPLIAPPVPQGF
ncbi:unnamed protein product [Sphagnum balticum]